MDESTAEVIQLVHSLAVYNDVVGIVSSDDNVVGSGVAIV